MRISRGATILLVAASLSTGCGESTTPHTVIDLSEPRVAVPPQQVAIDPTLLGRAVDAARALSRAKSLLVTRPGRLVSVIVDGVLPAVRP